jgi:uncharacterized Zn-finger protein
MYTHTGEKPFICQVNGCEKKFTEKGNMKTHAKKHLASVSKSYFNNRSTFSLTIVTQ